MNLETLEKLVASGESERLEFKKSTAEIKQIGETICAFLNSKQGGVILIGVTDQKKILGQSLSNHTLEELAQLYKKIEPSITPDIQTIEITGNKNVIVIHVKPSPDNVPFVFTGRPYQRIGPTTSILPQNLYQELLFDRMQPIKRWETMSADGFEIDDLDLDEIRLFLRAAKTQERVGKHLTNDLAETLEKLQLTKNGQLTNAAMTLFGKNQKGCYPQCILQMARFRGKDKTEFIDQNLIHGHAFELLDAGMQFLRRHIPVSGRYEPFNLKRIDQELIPFKALREALLNAIIHKDYSHPGTSIYIDVYDDRVEIANYGTLSRDLTLEKLKKVHRSVRRNLIISQMFFNCGFIEQWGKGTLSMIELCKEFKIQEPFFDCSGGFFTITFPAPVGKTRIEDLEVALKNLTTTQKKLVRQLSKGSKFTLAELAEVLKPISGRRIREDLQILKNLDLISAIGKGRGSCWTIYPHTPAFNKT